MRSPNSILTVSSIKMNQAHADCRVARNAMSRAAVPSVRSRPSSTSTSNRPGLVVRPVTATRVAWISAPALIPRSAAVPRTAASTCGLVERLERAQAPRPAPSTWPASPGTDKCFSTASGSYSTGSRKKRPRLLDEIGEPLRARTQQLEQPLRTHASSATTGCASRPARREQRPDGRRAARSSAAAPMYWPFIQSSFSVLNTALPPLMPSSEKLSISSRASTSARGRRPATSRAAPGS